MESTRNITFADGLQTFTINGGYEIRFQPTDLKFAERIFSVMEEMSEIQTRYAAMGENALPDVDFSAMNENSETAQAYTRETRERFDAFQQIDSELRNRIDALLGDGAAKGIFGGTNLTAHADGLPIWLNLLLALLDVFPEQAKKEAGLSDERLKAVTARYTQKYTEMRDFHKKRRKRR